MLEVRRSEDRGRANFGWLDSRHTFSFGRYYDPAFLGFGPLRVINEDRVRPGAGFDPHGHRDMEILSYVISGVLEHRDSMGNGSIIRPGDVQRMTAGTGVRHSEYNASDADPVHFLQIWIEPEAEGLEPGYEQRAFPEADRLGRLKLVASRNGDEGSVTIHQDVALYVSLLEHGDRLEHALTAGRLGWLQVVRGKLVANGTALSTGDGLALEGPAELVVEGAVDPGTSEQGSGEQGSAHTEVLLFDMVDTRGGGRPH